MKKQVMTLAITAGLAACSAQAAVILDTTHGGEVNLRDILGVADLPTLNAAQTTQETWSASPYSSKLIVEYAGNAAINEFGYYAAGDTSVLTPVFIGTDAAGATATITFSGSIGFYLKGAAGTFYSENGLNASSADQVATFPLSATGAAFQALHGSVGDVLAWEDLKVGGGSDTDYNDMVLTITPVPEPSTYIAGGLALLPLLFGLRARLAKK